METLTVTPVMKPGKKTAIVLFNLGGPDQKSSVEPFLFNLFFDPAIIRVPRPLRYFLARLISKKRAPVAAEIYDKIGGKSPILENTEKQADALKNALRNEGDVGVFIAMRYWHPRAAQTVQEVKAFAPDTVILLPLYPQYSTTTTASSLAEWEKEAARAGLSVPTYKICCYPRQLGFVQAYAEAILPFLAEAKKTGAAPRLLFSAHGLPEKIVKGGDPYQQQVEASTQAVLEALRVLGHEGLDAVNCYQSRVGPMKWIGPSTEEEIGRAGRDGKNIILVPIAFVSEHSETLVELDMEYAHLAAEQGVANYWRVPTVSTAPHFIEGLATMCKSLIVAQKPMSLPGGGCCATPQKHGACAA